MNPEVKRLRAVITELKEILVAVNKYARLMKKACDKAEQEMSLKDRQMLDISKELERVTEERDHLRRQIEGRATMEMING